MDLIVFHILSTPSHLNVTFRLANELKKIIALYIFVKINIDQK